MNVHFKITRGLLQGISADLLRPHPYAAERVGFLFARRGTIDENNLLILASDYLCLPDHLYIDDPSVGARINSEAIRNVFQKVMDTGMSAIHVHSHDFSDHPGFSRTDEKSLSRLIPALHNVNPTIPHGAIVLGRTGIAGTLWLSQNHRKAISQVSVIGYPCQFMRRP